jgi:hypothetical protein
MNVQISEPLHSVSTPHSAKGKLSVRHLGAVFTVQAPASLQRNWYLNRFRISRSLIFGNIFILPWNMKREIKTEGKKISKRKKYRSHMTKSRRNLQAVRFSVEEKSSMLTG